MPKDQEQSKVDNAAGERFIKYLSQGNVWIYRLSRGYLGRNWRLGKGVKKKGFPICMVTTTGKKTGKARTVPLLHIPDGENVIIVATKGGLPSHPQWYYNLVADPNVTVEFRGRKRAMLARTATDEERAAWWPRLEQMYVNFENYEKWTDGVRQIPVVICEPK